MQRSDRRSRWSVLTLLGCVLFVEAAWGAETSPRPNIVYLLADDLGWADVGFHGGKIRTPNIDKLAASGTRLEQYYVQSLCSPTRAALLTGRYPFRLGLQVGVIFPWVQYGLPLEEVTLPQRLRESGYQTAIVGKWHLGHFRPEYLPTRRGFDQQYGLYNGMIDYNTHLRDGGLDWHRNDRGVTEEGYSTHLITREAIRVLKERDPAKPVFLYVPFNAVHAPYQVPESYAASYADLPESRRDYAGMVASLDEAVGKIVATIDELGLRDNTLIVFHSDNGGPSPGTVTDNGPLRSGKATLYEGGVRVPALASWPGKIPAGATVSEPIHVTDWYPTLLALAGTEPPEGRVVDGKDIWPVVAQGARTTRQAIVLNANPNAGAIRVGDWKLVINGAREHGSIARVFTGGEPGKVEVAEEVVELFNIPNDPYEKVNLAEKEPDRVRALRQQLESLASQSIPPGVTPRPEGYKAPKVWGEAD